MRQAFKRFVATLVAAVTIATPGTVWAGDYCATYAQVKSHTTGGDYVGGILSYETMGSVARSEGSTSTTSTYTTTAQVGSQGSGALVTMTTTETRTEPGNTVTTDEPIGYYEMNDGSMYQINCVTGEYKKIG